MKKVLVLSLALILLLGITSHGTSSYFSDTETSAGNTFTAWVEEVICAKFNVSNDEDDKIYKYNDLGNFVGSFGLSGGNTRPMGVAAVGDDIYILDQADKQVYRYTSSGTLVEVSKTLWKSKGGSLGNPDGLAIYDNEMWVVDWGPDIIFGYVLRDGSGAFPGPGDLNATWEIALDKDNKHAAGLAIDSTYLYVLDSADHQFYRYPYPAGTPVTVSKVLLEYTSDNELQNPVGAMYDGTNNILWVVDQDTDKIYEYDVTNLFNGNGSINAIDEFPLHPDNDDATGM